MAFDIIITNAGRAALINAANTGTLPVQIAQIGVSATALSANPAMTALTGELKRLATISGAVVADDTIHVTLRDDSADAYDLRAVGLYLADGTLFALYGQTLPILEKTAGSIALLAIDVIFADISAASISFGSTEFMNPPATEAVQGVAAIATQAEVTTGTNNTRIVTPLRLAQRLASVLPAQATEAILGIARLATQAEVTAGTDNTRIVTPLRLAQRLAAALPVQATETILGIARLATQAEVTAGTDNTRIVTPLRLAQRLAPVIQSVTDEVTARAAGDAAISARTITGGGLATGGGSLASDRVISVVAATVAQLLAGTDSGSAITPATFGPIIKSYGQNGYIILALGDPANAFCIQWGRFVAAANAATPVNFPVAFSQCFVALVDGLNTGAGNDQDNYPAVRTNSISPFGFQAWSARDETSPCSFIAVGTMNLTGGAPTPPPPLPPGDGGGGDGGGGGSELPPDNVGGGSEVLP